MDRKAQETVRQIRQLENSFCNPRKLGEASELRADLRGEGYSDAEINRMIEGDL